VAGMQVVRVDERPGFYHRPEWYRPLLFGDNMYMNVTYLLPGVGMVMGSKREKEVEPLERAIYMLEGRVQVTCGDSKYELVPHTAMLVPLQPGPQVEVKNLGERTACFVTVFSPPPHPDLKIESVERLEQLYRDAKRVVKTPEEMKDVIGTRQA